jgi:hypothetical protein
MQPSPGLCAQLAEAGALEEALEKRDALYRRKVRPRILQYTASHLGSEKR